MNWSISTPNIKLVLKEYDLSTFLMIKLRPVHNQIGLYSLRAHSIIIIQLLEAICWILLMEPIVIIEEFLSLLNSFYSKEKNSYGIVDDDS